MVEDGVKMGVFRSWGKIGVLICGGVDKKVRFGVLLGVSGLIGVE